MADQAENLPQVWIRHHFGDPGSIRPLREMLQPFQERSPNTVFEPTNMPDIHIEKTFVKLLLPRIRRKMMKSFTKEVDSRCYNLFKKGSYV